MSAPAQPLVVGEWMLAWLPDASGVCPACGEPFTESHAYLREDEAHSTNDEIAYEKRCISCILPPGPA